MEVDPNALVTVAQTAVAGWASKEMLGKLLGPSAEYLGEVGKEITKKRIEQFGHIMDRARKMLGPRLEEQGAVPPRVLQEIINAGTFCDDELGAEYFGGVLASSRTDLPRDDRGVYFMGIISGLSAYQLRLHYCVYHWVKAAHTGTDALNLGADEDRRRLMTFVPMSTVFDSMAFSKAEGRQAGQIMQESYFALSEAGLIGDQWRYGGVESLNKLDPTVTEAGLLITPSLLGARLFFWAQGLGHMDMRTYLADHASFTVAEGISIDFNGVRKVPRR